MALEMTVAIRLRKDAALRNFPGPRPAGKRGRPRSYGPDVIELAKGGGQRRGWASGTFSLYGVATVKRYKMFLATWQPVRGPIRVVLVDEPNGWRAFFCTNVTDTGADLLTIVADRFSLEITFGDCKEIVGAGQQQLRFVRANVGAFHLCLWPITMTEAWAWGRESEELADRSDSPWDKATRHPSHADKGRAWRRALLSEKIRAFLRPGVKESEIQAMAERLLILAA